VGRGKSEHHKSAPNIVEGRDEKGQLLTGAESSKRAEVLKTSEFLPSLGQVQQKTYRQTQPLSSGWAVRLKTWAPFIGDSPPSPLNYVRGYGVTM